MSLIRTSSYPDTASASCQTLCTPQSPSTTNNQDGSFIKPKRRISFDERVSVLEFESNSWVSVKDIAQLSPVGSRERSRVVPRIIVCGRDDGSHSEMDDLYPSFPGLEDKRNATPSSLSQLLLQETRSILMVDPHDIFLTIFSKRLQSSLPHVRISKAHSAEEALQLLSKQTFDIIITEERLSLFHKQASSSKLSSGSALLAYLRSNHAPKIRHSLLIGVTAHWQSDHAAMSKSGLDFCWSKAPPPTLDRPLLEEMMHKLLLKRGKHELAKEFMAKDSGANEDVSGTQRQ